MFVYSDLLDKTIFIGGGVFCALLIALFVKYMWHFDGVNYMKRAFFKALYRGTIDDITNPKEGDEIKDKKR